MLASPSPDCVVVVNRDPLLIHARYPDDHETLAFAAAIEIARSSARLPGVAGFGLEWEEFSALLDRYFPGAHSAYLGTSVSRPVPYTQEFEDLVALLLEHRSDESSEGRWLAYAVAACCMGDDHLWQDMGLPDRQALSSLMQRRFASLYAKNTGNMRWKKFLYKQLCERHGAVVCRSPSCVVCVDYQNCFGPEEEGSWQTRRR